MVAGLVWDGEPVYTNVSSVDGETTERFDLRCSILAGRWAEFPHCNSNAKATNKGRRSWTCYMDQHVFSLLYHDLKDNMLRCRNCGEGWCCTFTEPARLVDGRRPRPPQCKMCKLYGLKQKKPPFLCVECGDFFCHDTKGLARKCYWNHLCLEFQNSGIPSAIWLSQYKQWNDRRIRDCKEADECSI